MIRNFMPGALWGLPVAAAICASVVGSLELVVAFYVTASIAIATTLIVDVLERAA